MAAATTASEEDMRKARLPLGYRDQCSALLIPLNKCRRKTMYLPWECENERHSYEKCQYDDYIRRMKKMAKQSLPESEDA